MLIIIVSLLGLDFMLLVNLLFFVLCDSRISHYYECRLFAFEQRSVSNIQRPLTRV